MRAALADRESGGRGQHIDMALLDVMVGTLANRAMNYLVTGKSPHRLGNIHPAIAPCQAIPTKGNWIILAVGNEPSMQKQRKDLQDRSLSMK